MSESQQFKQVGTLFHQPLWKMQTMYLPRVHDETTRLLSIAIPQRKRSLVSWKWRVLYTLLIIILTEGATLSSLWLLNHGSSLKHLIAQYQPAPTELGLSSPGGAQILGIQSGGGTPYPGIPWLRLSYPTCGNSNLSGHTLKNVIAGYHHHGVHILLLVCQRDLAKILAPAYLQDAAQGNADAVQCGNEQMKHDSIYVRYVPPALYAHFFALCERTMHAVHPNIPILIGSLDPRIVGPDNAILMQQVNYLNDMQIEMNTAITPGGNWTWMRERIGLNDSWHNGYPNSATNNLYQLFVFWAQQFGTDIQGLHDHLWVVEGTACFTGCGLTGTQQVATSHIITLITDVLTSTKYHIPFFYFTGTDFVLNGVVFPNGVLDVYWYAKPLRQDIRSPLRALEMTCNSQKMMVTWQEKLLALLYAGCTLPENYVSTLEA